MVQLFTLAPLAFALLASNLAQTAPLPSQKRQDGGDFHLQNGLDAQKQNAQFASLSASSSCNDGEQACVGGDFAQCVGGSFVTTPCSGGLKCVALPLVNKAGTSVTCDTEADAASRIEATGATGGLTGSGSGSSSGATSGSSGAAANSTDSSAGTTTTTSSTNDAASGSSASDSSASSTTSSDSSSSSSASGSGDFHLQNGLDAQKLNAQFASLTADSSCNDGDQACVSGDFAQCVSGAFVTTPCSGGSTCVALPLVNKAGTSITCDVEADAVGRIEATGATGGLTGDGSTSTSTASSAATSASSVGSSTSSSSTGASGSSSSGATATSSSSDDAGSMNNAAASSDSGSDSTSSDFKLSNGKAAQALNKKFQSLTADSSCTDGDQACVSGQFAQCVGGKFITTSCGSGNVCVALPLVNKAGTSVTCDTEADAVARITATGASSSLTG